MSSNPFVVLGVRPDADDAELKRAYFRKLREHPPETDPEEFQAVQEAFETLRDPVRRHAAMQPELPQRLRDLMRAAMTSHSAAAALELLERAVSDFPQHVPAHVMRASCLAQLKPAEGLAAVRALSTRFPNDVEVHLLHASLEHGAERRAALRRAREVAPKDRRPLLMDARELIGLKRFDEALAALDAAKAVPDHTDVSDAQLEGTRLLARMERAERLELDGVQPELAPVLVSLAGTMIDTQRHVYARTLLDKVEQLQPQRPPIPLGPSRLIPLEQLPRATREAVEHNAHTPSPQTIRIKSPPKAKSWLMKPVWWVELRRLHLIVRRANGVQVCPILSLHLQQRDADVPLMLCDRTDAGLSGMPELAHLFEVAMSRKRRLLDLMSKDLIETEQSLEPLQWTPSSNA